MTYQLRHDWEMTHQLKYAHLFIKNPQALVQQCRQMGISNRKWAMDTLGAMGITEYDMKWAILQGHADIVTDEEGWLCYVDHRITREVMQRLTGKETK